MVHMPRTVARRIAQASARDEVVVVVPRKGKPSRVFRLEKYLKMKDLPRKVRPWEARGAKASPPDPLGAIDGRVLIPPRRENMYE